MKIAMVSDAVYPYNKGGKEKRLFELSTRMAAKGHDVHVYCMKWWDGADTRVENGVHLHAISKKYSLYVGERRSITQALLFSLACLRLLFETWDVIDVDHMPFFPLLTMKIVCMLKGKRMMATWHEVWGPDYWNSYLGSKGFIAACVESLSMRAPDAIIAASRLTEQRLKEHVRKTPISYLPNGVDVAHIRSIKKSSKSYDVMYAGRLLAHKHVDVLIHAIHILKATHPSIRCVIVGDGPEKQSLLKLTAHLSIEDQVTCIDFFQEHDDLYALMKSSHVFVLPSDREGFGLAVVEAHACGTPVITIDHPDNAARFLVEPQYAVPLTPEAIANAIRDVLNTKPSISANDLPEWKSIADQYEAICTRFV